MRLEMREMKKIDITSIPQCLTRAFYTRSKQHLWYKAVHYAGHHFGFQDAWYLSSTGNEVSC